jgi:nucleoside 2-deoxyribosyltransferase
MKFYIASRTARADDIKEMRDMLQTLNHEVYDWTMFASIKRPYIESEVAPIAQAELAAVKKADVFILLGDEGGTGMYVELGYALSTSAKIYCIGNNNDVTVFQYLPEVTRVDSFEDVLADLLRHNN